MKLIKGGGLARALLPGSLGRALGEVREEDADGGGESRASLVPAGTTWWKISTSAREEVGGDGNRKRS